MNSRALIYQLPLAPPPPLSPPPPEKLLLLLLSLPPDEKPPNELWDEPPLDDGKSMYQPPAEVSPRELKTVPRRLRSRLMRIDATTIPRNRNGKPDEFPFCAGAYRVVPIGAERGAGC